MDTWDALKLLADPTRMRLIYLLRQEELSVAELQEILGMGQSRISSHLGLLRQGDLVLDRKDGKKNFYQLNPRLDSKLLGVINAACDSLDGQSDIAEDNANLQRVLQQRRQEAERYFNLVAGRLGKNYCPGRSWESIGHFLLHLIPQIRIADLGAGEGMISQLLARRAEHVTCVDSSKRMVEVGTELAQKNGLTNLEYKHGDIESVPLKDKSVHLALLSQALHHAQHPERAIAEAFRILKPGGSVAILDLNEHHFEKAHELYADRWLGFSQNTMHRYLRDAGFQNIDVRIVAREEEAPHFETLFAYGEKS